MIKNAESSHLATLGGNFIWFLNLLYRRHPNKAALFSGLLNVYLFVHGDGIEGGILGVELKVGLADVGLSARPGDHVAQAVPGDGGAVIRCEAGDEIALFVDKGGADAAAYVGVEHDLRVHGIDLAHNAEFKGGFGVKSLESVPGEGGHAKAATGLFGYTDLNLVLGVSLGRAVVDYALGIFVRIVDSGGDVDRAGVKVTVVGQVGGAVVAVVVDTVPAGGKADLQLFGGVVEDRVENIVGSVPHGLDLGGGGVIVVHLKVLVKVRADNGLGHGPAGEVAGLASCDASRAVGLPRAEITNVAAELVVPADNALGVASEVLGGVVVEVMGQLRRSGGPVETVRGIAVAHDGPLAAVVVGVLA